MFWQNSGTGVAVRLSKFNPDLDPDELLARTLGRIAARVGARVQVELPDGCKFELGPMRAQLADFHFCGADVEPGSPWCAEHRARCYVPAAGRRKDVDR